MYIDALHNKKAEVVQFIVRENGERKIETHPVDHHFYIEDPRGSYRSMWGHPLKKITPSTSTEKRKLLNQFTGRKWESDINPIMRLIEQKYKNSETPKLNVAFFDIETDFDLVHGYSDPADAFNPITSVAVYLQWCKTMVCLAVPPKTMTRERADQIAEEVGNTIIFDREADMLDAFIDLVDDADVVSGWNSEAYDIPYIVHRIVRLLGKQETRRLSPFNEMVAKRTFERGGKELNTYDFPGKLHLDYMQLYKKYTYEEKHSYSLNSIAEIELDDKKVEYDGSLHQLYNYDFKKFLEYNIQDTMLLDRLDAKLQYIDLCNTIAHANHVLIATTMGAVAMIDQAIVVEAHDNGVIVPDNNRSEVDSRAAGGWVATPKTGLHKWIGSADLTSLYPSVIRAFNMSPETIVGQLDLSETYREIDTWIGAAASHTYGNWWNDRFCPLEMERFHSRDYSTKMKLKLESGETYDVTGSELNDLIFHSGQPWCISANGTVFNHSKQGIIPTLLTKWFRERKQLQGTSKKWIKLGAGIELDAELASKVAEILNAKKK